jgi:hypothetical protein
MWMALLVLLTNGVLEVPASQWKAVDLVVLNHGSVLDCEFEVIKGSRVQVMVTDLREAQRFHRGRSVRPLFASGFDNDAHFRYRFREAGRYVLIVDNRIEGRGPTLVNLRLELTNPRSMEARELPPERRRAVVALSLLVFGLIVVVSARQFLRAI